MIAMKQRSTAVQQVPDHIVAYLLHRLTGAGRFELDSEDLAEAIHYRLTTNATAGKVTYVGHRIYQDSADKKNGDVLR